MQPIIRTTVYGRTDGTVCARTTADMRQDTHTQTHTHDCSDKKAHIPLVPINKIKDEERLIDVKQFSPFAHNIQYTLLTLQSLNLLIVLNVQGGAQGHSFQSFSKAGS